MQDLKTLNFYPRIIFIQGLSGRVFPGKGININPVMIYRFIAVKKSDIITPSALLCWVVVPMFRNNFT
jgi:hypothetical protein